MTESEMEKNQNLFRGMSRYLVPFAGITTIFFAMMFNLLSYNWGVLGRASMFNGALPLDYDLLTRAIIAVIASVLILIGVTGYTYRLGVKVNAFRS